MNIIDISQEVLSCKVFPGDDSPRAERIKSMEQGELYNLSVFSMCAHNGTHIDAPFHFLKDGKTVERIPLTAFVGDCFVARHEGDVTAEDAREIMRKAENAGANERILIAGAATLTLGAAEVFAEGAYFLSAAPLNFAGFDGAPCRAYLIEK